MTKNKRFDITVDEANIVMITVDGKPYSTRKVIELLQELDNENKKLKQEKKKIFDIINNKIIELGLEWYGAEDNSKEEKEADIQLNVLEDVRDELKCIIKENAKMSNR